MKVHILYKTMAGPAGGGNQFLRALCHLFEAVEKQADGAASADVVLLNSHHFLLRAAREKLRFPRKIFVQRVDGPMALYNRQSDPRDFMVKTAAAMISDGTIFQSEWSRDANYRLGFPRNRFDAVIHNSVDPAIFNSNGKAAFSSDRKTRIMAASWSPNPNKGFDVYRWLDRNLDFSRFEMTFAGNSPVAFRNITSVPPVDSRGMARLLKRHDIFIFASRIEACSNSLLEAMHCGLPVIAADSSSNPEVVGSGGELFRRPEEIPGLLDRLVAGYAGYRARLCPPSIEDAARKYLDFMEGIYEKVESGAYRPKRFGKGAAALFCARLFIRRSCAWLDAFLSRARAAGGG